MDETRQPLDLHVHTREGSTCSNMSAERVAAEYHRLGLPALAITDHHSLAGVKTLREEFNVNVLPGVEIFVKGSPSKDYGEYLVFAPEEKLEKMIYPVEFYFDRPFITLEDALARGFFDDGNLVIWCHPPFDYSDWFRFCITHIGEHIDAVEIANFMSNIPFEDENIHLLKKYKLADLPLVTNSDAHNMKNFMAYHNVFNTPVLTVQDLITAVKQKQFEINIAGGEVLG